MTGTIESGGVSETVPPEAEAIEGGSMTGKGNVVTEPLKIRKRIGYTTYEVEARFNPASRETLDDKTLRLVRGETIKDSGEVP
jgi:hypothetical protein